MRFSIGGTFAKCAGCGGDDFFPALAISSGRRGVYICARCGNESEYTELIRAGKEALRRAGQKHPEAGESG
ncbi:MAG TPA: hypothetical protein VHG88_15550 [Burkholderiales bacterium]|nr:hypothetical protein [Burkholderiales bacterium]